MLHRLRLLHKLADKGFVNNTYVLKIKQLKRTQQAPAFKPIPISMFVNQKPHFAWYLRRNEKRIIEIGILVSLLATIIILIIKNWR